MTFALATIEQNGKPTAAIKTDSTYWPLATAAKAVGIIGLDADLLSVLGKWDETWPLLNKLSIECSAGRINPQLPIYEGGCKVLAPLLYPRKVICAGANYYAHVREMGTSRIDKAELNPFFFLKAPTTTVVGPGPNVKMPKHDQAFDWEIELAVVIGKTCKDLSAEQALNYVAGYMVCIDFTARRLQFEAAPPRFRVDWFGSKCQDTTCPIGPILVPAGFVKDPHDLRIRLSVNGVIKQDSSTADMIFTVDELVAAASEVLTLEPGDLILTGTPAGVGHPRKDYLKVGDRVIGTIEGLGSLEVDIIS